MRWKVGIITASDKGARGEREDTSAQVIREMVEEELGGEIVEHRVVPDEKNEIIASLIELSDYYRADLILTTGGIGMAARDVTPEATREVTDRLVPGIPEAMRYAAIQRTPFAMLSRSVAGVRGQSLIINLPGDPRGVHESLAAILNVLPHALSILSGNPAPFNEYF
ncbi:MogA/MoaB family molybdenum cofactor biosynthesis protein [Gorillibacterium timonense]|uniref:MogA/MoaB family molybdenum cofactor biosynthesis protein n=1 Tax=Gorillibacterium timonense TaxID=1689269 RepID=UPI00071CE708|nr:MogA/MoaB family molybdenum cofactor biosynthesis protein [Gorillibacterium timonense]